MFYLFLVVSFLFLFVTPICVFFFFNDTATTEIYTLSLHDALPIYGGVELSRTEVVHAVVGRMTLHGSMTQAQELVREVLAAVAAAGLDVGKKLPNGEIPRTRGCDIQKPRFVFGVAESLKSFDVVCGQDHRLKIAALSSRSSRMRRNRSTSARRA